LKAFGVGKTMCEPHSRDVRRTHLGQERCVNLISGFPTLDEGEHEFDPTLVRTFAIRACVTHLMDKAEKEIRFPRAEAAQKVTQFALKGYVRNTPDLAHR
jgi:hypothetical protein